MGKEGVNLARGAVGRWGVVVVVVEGVGFRRGDGAFIDVGICDGPRVDVTETSGIDAITPISPPLPLSFPLPFSVSVSFFVGMGVG